MSKFYFVQHAETKAPDEITKGHTEWPLVEDSTRRDRLTEWFADKSLENPLVVSSDLNRAKCIAARINSELDATHKTSESLREIDFGELTGKSLEEYKEKNPEHKVRKYREFAHEKPLPGGESPKELSSRVLAAVQKLQSHDGDVVFVTHTTPMFTIIADVYDQPQYNTEYELQYCEVFATDTDLSKIVANVRFPVQKDIITIV